MRRIERFYVDGRWQCPAGERTVDVMDPRTGTPNGRVRLASQADVDRAVSAARRAFGAFSRTPVADRISLLEEIIDQYAREMDRMAEAIAAEMGAPPALARDVQAVMGLTHFRTTLDLLRGFAFEEKRDGFVLRREPIGVCALITPWNWPANQMACKIAPALAVGCTMVLKPSEIAPFSAQVMAEILDAAGAPAGVFNLVQGDGETAGQALAAHPQVDMVSFTGSTRGGIAVALAAAPTVKRVHQELGGKSANLILPDADLESAVSRGVRAMMTNSGQTCSAPSRMLVPVDRLDQVREIAAAAAAEIVVGEGEGAIGPVASAAQWERVQHFIAAGIAEGAELVAGGEGRPRGLERGWFVRPTVFAGVTSGMTIAREEIFGPVLSILAYRDIEEAIRIANDTPYGLAAYIEAGDAAAAIPVARRLRAGQVRINGARSDPRAPFGGYGQSGNGREWGVEGLEAYLETKAMLLP